MMLLDLLSWLGTLSQIRRTFLFLRTDHSLTEKDSQSILYTCMLAYMWLCAHAGLYSNMRFILLDSLFCESLLALLTNGVTWW